MNKKMITYVLGILLITEGALLLLPTLIGLYYKEDVVPFLITIAATVISGFVMIRFKPHDKTIVSMDGFAIVSLGWIFISLFGALPFFISKEIPNYLDAVFEVVSGFTTTGSSILTNVEALSKGMLFWRSFTHWIGGMGILVFVIAIMPKTDSSSMHVMRAEVPGPTVGKLVSKLSVSARILYGIYCVMTLIEIVMLALGGMPLFDSIVNSFATAGTGGFAVLNKSIEGYNSLYAEMVIAVFMVLFGVNFNLYYFILIKQGKQAVKNEELRWYLGIIGGATLIIAGDLILTKHSVGESFRYAFFQVSSIITTTGFSTTNFDMWPVLSKAVIVLLMFCGACAGSTGGGLKVSRIIILTKGSVREVRKAANPRRVESVKIDHHSVDESVVKSVFVYFAAEMFLIAVSTLLLCFEGRDLVTSFTAVLSCVSNVGPGLEAVGPAGNFADFSGLGKLLLSFDMLAGRLELVPMFMLFSPLAWSKKYA